MTYEAIQVALKSIGQESDSELKKVCDHVGRELQKGSVDINEAIRLLSDHILKFEHAQLFKKYLSNILLALVSTRIPLKPVFSSKEFGSCNDAEKTNHLEFSILLALMSDHPDILQYALKYLEINSIPPFEVFIHHEESYNVAPKKRRLQSCRQKITDLHMVQCCYTLLSKLPNELASKWDWTKFVDSFKDHPNDEIRWMLKESMVILTNMTEAQSKILSKNLSLTGEDCLKNQFTTDTCCVSNEADIGAADLSPAGVVNVDGILLPIYDKSNVQESNLVPVKSTVNNLRSLALAVASGKALSLMGPVGSGKTSLVEHLAAITGRKGVAFKKIQLGDQTDSRMLLGSHQCTDVPGEFVWRPGVLTEAVQNGHWLLLEDIDCAALDVASTLSSLLERNALCVPGYRDSLPVTPGFQLFVTQRTIVTNFGYQKKISNSSTLLQKHLTQINVEPLSRAELSEIIQSHYPSLTTVCSRMIEVFMMFSVGSHDTSLQTQEVVKETNNVTVLRGSRLISTRDLLKWCSRAVADFNVTSPDSALKVLQDALDIFTCSVSSPEHRLELAKKVGLCLGIVEAKTEFYSKHYKPNVSLTPRALEVGRAKVLRKEKGLDSINFDNEQVVFSFTRQSACLLERIACCVTTNEPVLLVGETGTGKTSSVQYLARQTGHKLVVINMNQQSDSADLLGGYKPVDMKYVIRPMKDEFENLFRSYYNVEKNKKFLNHIETCYSTENWNALLTLMKQSHKAAVQRLTKEKSEKRLKTWTAFGYKLVKLEQQVKAASRLTFAFIEGSLVKAMQEGYWVLLDEINLASAEILECLAGLLEDKNETIELLEKGDKVPIKRHPDFTLFACMNPATDVGKKDLPVGLRNRFTEFFIDELTERNDLIMLIGDYLKHINNGAIFESIYKFYIHIRKEAKLSLVDGAGNAPHYSLRTLCRALTAAARSNCGTVARSLYESFCLSFLTQLDSSSHPKVEAMIAKAVIGKNVQSILKQIIPQPKTKGEFLNFEGHWIPQGKLDIAIPEGYILTPTVRKNLRDIARIISLGKLPVLLQGDTSVGKTSLITYIAKASGNYCVRINNHEHTDLQEYIGSYATDANGKLVFKEGVLVEAMRKGYWIILDELNLAPSDVLEALNRVLDDNRELFIPETQQVIKADPNFMLFATQNPPGLYGGRKMLSRAFRNRFVELHFDEIPRSELETILHQRCHVPPAYSKKMIAVMAELQVRRRGSAAVQGKDGFITLRDLFRWGQRYKHASKESLTDDKFYDWDQHIADEGYLILAGKVRQTDERKIIEDVIEKHIKRIVNPENLFSLHQMTSPVTKPILEMILNNQLEEFSHVVWTYNMRRLAVLIAKAFTFHEPVLLVGETGCGKTTICQVLATLKKRQLLSVNCHMHTESSDFLGGLRPVRQYKNDGRLFEWVDGPLIQAMESGDMFLADEISLADDSVLERLNSLLEPERQLVLAERGMEDNSDIVVITAEKNFHFIGTMNPGGDFGKKELSPALRNRFTEIWCDSVTSRTDLLKVLEKSVSRGISLGNQEDGSSGIGSSILDFADWLKASEVANKFPFSIRDLLSWVQFINVTVNKGLLDAPEAYVHGACMTFLDCFGTASTGHIDSETLYLVRKTAVNFLLNQIKSVGNECTDSLMQMLCERQTAFVAESDAHKFGIHPFYIDIGENTSICEEQKFTFTAPTTGSNTLRILRGLQLNKAILLEGNPGVGKTSLVTALAKSAGYNVVRINLSDQTDITDLFGTDLPTEDGSFTFKEGAFLSALQNGDWILLDELNLAPQPVLEGLNACLDHRGEVYIPELGKTFKVKQETRIFACQNPLKQGGARRGLPVSFLNRFTQVYIDTLRHDDLVYIVESQYPSLPKDVLHRIVKFNCKVAHEICELQSWGHRGAPWEMNLRDIQRWCEALIDDQNKGDGVSPGKFVNMLYINRMRTAEDKEKMTWTYDEIFCPDYPRSESAPMFQITDGEIIIGDVTLQRKYAKVFKNRRAIETNSLILRNQLPTLKALAQSVKMNWLSILVGPTATGKSSVVQVLADLTGNELQVVPVTSAMDVSDLLGGFEQVDYNRTLENLYDKIEALTFETVRNTWLDSNLQNPNQTQSNKFLSQLHHYKSSNEKSINGEDETENFNEKMKFLLNHCEELMKCIKMQESIWLRLVEIINNLKKLQEKVSKVSAINVGGKFEWVDSLLVKTMTEGSWILLDNVNLTSAAVLDRLNGLLESNGVLSIPERGEFSEIRPHPNFRVFFTMDPKYGEISRAMRNRGVEIFLLRPDDWKSTLCETITHLDLVALVSSCGLPEQYHRICLECHELMTSFVQGFERPTLAHLLQASHLTWQQILRGIPVKTAICTSFSDVYIKPRCGGDFLADVMTSLAEMKNNMVKALIELLEKESNDLIRKTSTNLPCRHTLTVKGLCLDSMYETTNLVAYPTVQQLTECAKSLYIFLNMFTAYQKCSDNCRNILFNVLNEAIQRGSPGYSLADEINKTANVTLKNNGNGGSDKIFYPEATKDQDVIRSNAKTLYLFYELSKVLVDNILPKIKSSLTAMSYSEAVTSGALADEFDEYPILKNCQKYLKAIDRYIEILIKKESSKLDHNEACHIIQLLSWRTRFLQVCSEPIYYAAHPNTRKTFRIEEVVPLLYIHCKWVEKHLMGALFSIVDDQNLKKSFEKDTVIVKLNDQNDLKMAKIGKKLRKIYGQPQLYENKEKYELCKTRTNIYAQISLDMNKPLESQLERTAFDFTLTSDMAMALDAPDTEVLSLIQENLAKIQTCIKGQVKPESEIKLLPVTSYIIQRLLNILQTQFIKVISSLCSGQTPGDFKLHTSFLEVLDTLVHLGKVSKVFPPSLLNILQAIQKLSEGNEDMLQRVSSLPVRFWDEFYKALVYSPACYPEPFFNVANKHSEDVMMELPVNSNRVSTNLPLMAYYIQKMTVSGGLEGFRQLLAYETVSLEERENYSVQLGTVLNVLWKNIGLLDSAAALKVKLDAEFEMTKYEQLTCNLHSIFTPVISRDTTVIPQNPIKELKDYFKDDTFVLDMMIDANKIYKELNNIIQGQSQDLDKLKAKILTSQLSLLTSLLFAKVMAEMSPVDHVEKYRLKAKYIKEDIETFEALLSSYYMHGLITGSITSSENIEKSSDITAEDYKVNRDGLIKVHPYCQILMEMKDKTADRIKKYAMCNTFRPDEPSYTSFVKDCKHFTKSVLSLKTTKDLCKNLISTSEVLYENIKKNVCNKSVLQSAQTTLKETASWLYSVNAFYNKISKDYSDAFPDLAKPLQCSISQTVYSITRLNDLVKEMVAKSEQGPLIGEIVTDLMVFPNQIPSYSEKEKYLNRFVSPNCTNLLTRNITMANHDLIVAEMECMNVLKMNLTELKMHCLASERTDKASVNAVLSTLCAIVKAWEKQQKDMEKKKQDDEALYVTKSKCEDEDEEAMAEEEISEMFPKHSESDFGEFKPPTLEQKPVKVTSTVNSKPLQLISSEDISLVYKWHSNFFKNLTTAEWLPSPKKSLSNDVVSAFLQRYPTFSRVIQNAWEALDADFESVVSPSLIVLISQIKDKVDGEGSKQDFYRSPWVSETRQCVPLLNKVKETTNELLDQWPDFPTLKYIIVIVDRILSFPVTSPVSRFLTGLELLRDKLEEWNKNAHKANNMIDISLSVGQQIINWRKLEMGHWKECLNNLYQRKQSEAHKYWFYLYSVVNSYLVTDEGSEPIPADRVITVLRDFMESSNLAEYEIRLDILYVYHCHLVHLEQSPRRDELLSILWNTYNFYSQFSAQVSSRIKDKRAPIEKKLRDFVKICTWDRDLSYWSVKDTVEKAHKALHKHTKEFENVLKESVSSCLVDNSSEVAADHVGIWDRPKRATGANAPAGGAYMIDPQNHLVLARNVKKYLDQAEEPHPMISEESLLNKVPSLLNKAKSLCKDTITNSGYPSLVQALDDFVTMIIETSTHLGTLEVDMETPKDRQKSQAKNIVQQKRKALADLFKYLAKLGLNYRTGLMILSTNGNLYDFTIPPVDLDAAISYLKSRRCDASLALLWSGCERYFQKNIARHRLLTAALQSPHQDLGIQNIERCKGFAAQLLKMTNSQKKSISKYSRALCDLRTLTTQLTNSLDIDSDTNISLLSQKVEILTESYANASILLDQFSVVLKSCPEKQFGAEFEPQFDEMLSNSPIVRCYRNSDEWKELYGKVKAMIASVNKQKAALLKLSNTIPKQIGKDIEKTPNVSQAHIDVTSEAVYQLESMCSNLKEILKSHQFTLNTIVEQDFLPRHPMLRSLADLLNHSKETLARLTEINRLNDITMEDGNVDLIQQSEELVATMLLIIQSIYKKHLPGDSKNSETEVLNAIDEIIDEWKEDEPSKDILEDKHLKELLQDKLSNDSKLLQLDTVIHKLSELLTNYVQFIATNKEIAGPKNAVMRLVPILEQLGLFVQYFVTQKVSVHRVSCKLLTVLLKIFSDLATKGFCKPSDLDMEDDDGEGGSGKLSSGTGLGDGEGQKDVSDRIENQDQLDDAQRPGEEKKEEERDSKEEEKGVNMSDDFDSHLQDVDKKEGDNESDNEDEDDADKQMGDIDNAAEKLDQQIWGSEDEEEEQEEQGKKEKEEKGKGESTGEKEMAAKEEDEGQDDGADGKERKKQKDINEMDEPEVDDDHVDNYHGNEPQYPEPEDFELPDDMNEDGEDGDNDDGETETENPFDIDVAKENLAEEENDDKEDDKDDGKDKNNGLEVSSDEEDGEGNDNDEQEKDEGKDEADDDEKSKDDEPEKEDTEENAENAEQDPDNPQSEEPEPENPAEKDDELPQNTEKMDEEDKIEEKKHEPNPQANPSSNDPTAGERAENAEMDRGTDDNVETNAEQPKDDETAPYEQAQEQVGEDKQSTGRSELDKSDKGHRGEKQAASRADASHDKQKKHENKPGSTDQERTLGEINKQHKQSRTLNVETEDQVDDAGDQKDNPEKDADAYQHVKQGKEDDLQAIDAATKEQADQQPILPTDEDQDAEELKDDDEIAMDVDDDDIQVEKSEELKPEKTKDGTEKEPEKAGNKKEGDDPTGETGMEVEGEKVLTSIVPRGNETTYHTKFDNTHKFQVEDITLQQYMTIREWLTSGRPANTGATGVWRTLWQESGGAARALCERLRLVLEPTGRSRRAGDFRTGRAINMRRVIPYIASHFRKDRIWLRRTKPAKREYKIAIAMDDSSSMADNRSKELAFESLALVSQALNLLESGDLAVLSFGEKPNLLHPFTEQFSEHSGSKILDQLRFDQTKTKIAQLLDFCSVLFDEQSIRSDAVNAKLLMIVSDGRGIYSEGETRVIQAVRRARQQGIFLVYVIIDNPDNKDSIMDIRRPLFDPVTNTMMGFVPYLDTFPFPFYLILRDMSALPTVLGDALRQWFELAANTAS